MKDKSTNQLFPACKFLRQTKVSSKLFVKIVLAVLVIGVYGNLYAQQPTVLGTAAVNGTYTTYDLNTVGGFRQVRMQATSNASTGTLNWLFVTGTAASPNYGSGIWRPYGGTLTLAGYNTFISPVGGTASALWNAGSGGADGFLPAVTAGNYYTFNITNNTASNNNMSVLETSFNPATISTVTKSPATVGAVVSPVITITMASVPAAGENVFVRYSTSSTFATSTIVQLSFVGTTGTASIPAQAATTIIYYYVYSSSKTKVAIDADVTTYGQSAHDMATLNLNNNAGANYNYTVLPVTVNATNAVNNASYNTLALAFAAINSGTHTGADTVWIGGNTTEISSAVLNASGGPSSYTAVTVKPAGIRTVTGNLAAPLVDLNGADNVIIDGLNDGTNTLTFTNTSTGGAGTSTIRMYNGATVNTVQNCVIEGSTLSTADGVIMFGTGTNATIAVTSNTIKPAGANLPIYGVYASGTSNTAISIISNNIQDYFSATVSSSGINANTGSDAWTISSNKFYQSAARSVTSASSVILRAIQITTGGGHTITNNTIGFANASGTGTTSYTNTTASNQTQVTAIDLAGNATASSIQGNVIGNISFTNTSAATFVTPGMFCGIFVSSGNANIGTVTGNTIGASTGTGSITINCSSIAIIVGVYGIVAQSASPSTVNFQNNNIGAFNLIAVTSGIQYNFSGIYASGTATQNISDNIIGSTTTANSVVVGTGSTSNCTLIGINIITGTNATVTGNNIQNCAMTATGSSGLRGIFAAFSTGTLTITNNNVISCTQAGTGIFYGIFTSSDNITTLTISGNVLRSHTVTSATSNFYGIYNSGIIISAININNNQLGNASGGLVTYTVANSVIMYGIYVTNAAASVVLTIQSNDFRGIVNNVQGTGNHTYIQNTSSTFSQNISSNTFTALSINTTGSVTFISNSVSLGATGTKTVNDNAIVTSFTKTGGGANLYFYYDIGSSVGGSTISNDGNNFSNITVNGAIPVQGWFNNDGSGAVPVKNITNNTFNNIVANNSAVFPIQITNGSGNINNNTVTGCSAPGALTALNVTSGSFTIFSNTINSLSTSTSSSPIIGINIAGGTTHSIYYHTIYNLSSSATSTTISAITVTSGTTVKVYKNKVYGLSNSSNLATGGVYGINITGGTTVSVYNNMIGALTTPNAIFDDAIRGISLTGGTTLNIYYNTVHLNGSSAGSSFGSSALYAGTTPTLDLRNNILSNISTPGASGKTITYRRNGTSLANYASTSNNNIFYAGTPAGPTRLIYYDGTNSDQTIAAYKGRVVPGRDNLSGSASIPFISTTGSSPNFLHCNTSSIAESGGANIASYTDDYDDEIRQGNPGYLGTSVTGPDIGADEFESVACPATPIISSVSSAGPYYAGDNITISGSNLAGITYATINDINATIVSTALGGGSAVITIPITVADSVAVIQVGPTSSCIFSNTLSFVFSGYITKGLTAGNGTWSTNTIWRNNAVPVANAPATINTNDIVTLDVSADPIKFTINSGASFTHAASNGNVFGTTYLNNTTVNGTLVVDNSVTPILSSANRFISPKLIVTGSGTFFNSSSNAAAVNIVTFILNAGGTYNHNAIGSTAAGVLTDFPGNVSRSFGSTSNVIITKWANGNNAPINLPASGSPGWGNLTINVATLAGSWNQVGTLTNVQGNLNIQATGGGAAEFRLTGAATNTTAIGGNLTVSGGALTGTSGTGSSTVTVGGANATVSGGTIRGRTGSGVFTLTVTTGNMTVSSGSYIPSSSSGATVTTTVGGSFTVSGGTITSPGSGHTYVFSMASLTVSSGTFGMSSSNSSSLAITSTGNVTVSGTGSMISTSAGPITINCGGDYIQSSSSAPAFQFQNGTNAGHFLIIGGNFNMTNGTFIGGQAAADSIIFKGGVAAVTYTQSGGTMHVGGSPNVRNNFSIWPGKTLALNNSIIPASSSTSNNWSMTVFSGAILDCKTNSIGLATNPYTSVKVNLGATLRTAHTGGVFSSTTNGAASIVTTVANAVLDAGATYEFNGTLPQVTSVFTTTPGATPSNVSNMVINNAAGVTLSASYNVTAALQMQTGNLTLSTFNLTTVNITGAPFSNTKMVVTNSTGALGQPVALTTILFPVGNSGNYTPASYTFTANSTARYLNVRAVTPRNVNDVSATNYINNRWWNTDLSVTTGTYTYTSSYTFLPADVVGFAASIRLNKWNGSAWIVDVASLITGNILNSGTLTEATNTLSATAEWVGRVYVAPAIYTWTNPVSGSWLDQTKWTPVGVPGSGDGVIFDKAGSYNVFSMPVSITLTQMYNTGSTLNLRASAAGIVNISNASAAPQFRISAGASTTLDSLNAVNLNLLSGTSGTVSGSLNLQRTTHTVTIVTVGNLVFPSGGYFSYGNAITGFSGNPFGATGTPGAVIFQNGSICECFEGSNPFGATAADKITTFNSGSLFRYSDPLAASLPSASGRTYANFTYNANKISNMAAAANTFICDTLTVTVGTINFNLQGTPTPDHAVKGNINVASGATLTFSPAAAGTVNMNSGGTQIIWGTGIFNVNANATFDINAGTTASLQNSMSVNGTGNVAINGTLICTGENTITSTGSVALNSTGTLSMQSVNGISNGGIGNIRATTFTYNIGGNFIYSGTTNQITGSRLPLTLNSPSELTIANTGIAPANVVTLTNNNTTTPKINLTAGQFNAGTGGTLIISGGTNLVVGGGGNQYLAGAATDNIIRFATNGAVQGTPELWNVTIGTSGTGVDFTSNARINGILLINSGGFVNPNAPKYQTGSTLMYNTGGSYNRTIEWGNNSGLGFAGYPHHVTIQNGTTLDFLNPVFDVGCGGDLTLGTTTAGTLLLSSYMQPYDLVVKGNINIGGSAGTGTLTMSNSIGCDLRLTGNWTRNANGVVNFGGGNGRSVYFEGATDAIITANNGQYFPYLRMQKSTKPTKVTLADHVSIGFEVTFTKGTLDLGANNKFFSLLSNVNYDARVDVSDPINTDFIYGADDRFGQFIVQRYVPARRSWRLMAAPFSGIGTHSVSEAWQERGMPVYSTGLDYTAANWSASVAADSINNNFGTQITGGLASDGFDQSPNNNPSIKLYSGGTWTGPSFPINNVSVRSQDGWMLFLRGDRKTYGEITNQYKTPTITTLRPRGRIFIGSKVMISSGMTVVGNPYASAVDYFAMSRTGGAWPANPTYYMWDPYIGGAFGTGGFVTLTWNGTDFTRNVPSGIDNRYIPSGSAIMVDFPTGGASQIQINEANKNTDSNTTAFRPAAHHQMLTVLNTINADNSTYVSDGVLSLFDRTFNNDADLNDARKLTNFNENFALQRNGKLLSIERMKPVQDGDTIFYNIYKMQAKKYQLQFIMNNLEVPASLTAFLEDKYLKTKTAVHLHDTTRIDFRITNDAEAKPDRFRLVFRNAVKYAAINAFVLKGDIAVNWKVADEINIKEYIIERSADGNTFTDAGTIAAGGNSEVAVDYQWIDAAPQPGEYFYRIRSVSANDALAYSDIVKISIIKGSPGLYVFPNPVSGNTIQLQLNDKPAGQYEIRLMNSAGQYLLSKIIDHAGGTATKKIEPEQVLLNGVYNLEITTPAKTTTAIKVIVNR